MTSKTLQPWILLAPVLLSLALFVVMPVAIIFAYSFFRFVGPGAEKAAFQLGNWIDIFTDPFYLLGLWKTAKVAVIATVISVVVGYFPAYFLANTRSRHRPLLLMLLIVPFWISFIIRTMSWIHVLGSNGAINSGLESLGFIDKPFDMLFGQAAVLVGLVHFTLPFVILNIYVSLEGIDRNLVEASRSLGASQWSSFLNITLPISLPGLSTGTLLCFVLVSGAFITPLILGGPEDFLFGNLIYDTIMSELNLPLGAALSCVLLAFLGLFVWAFNRFVGLNQLYASLGNR
jgi:spermidine/putrescine transport system permease protein